MPPLRAASSIQVSFRPDPALQGRLAERRAAIAAHWEEVRRQRGDAVFDGTLLAVTSVSEGPTGALEIVAGAVPYSAYLAQRQGMPLGLHALGVSGLLLD